MPTWTNFFIVKTKGRRPRALESATLRRAKLRSSSAIAREKDDEFRHDDNSQKMVCVMCPKIPCEKIRLGCAVILAWAFAACARPRQVTGVSNQMLDAAPHAPHAIPYPRSRIESVADALSGVIVNDPYRWLEQSTDPEVIRWTEEQDRFAKSQLGRLPALGSMRKELRRVLRTGYLDFPLRVGESRAFFLMRRDATQEKTTLRLHRATDDTEIVLVDPNAWPPTDRRAFEEFWPSRDGKHVVIRTSENNTDRSTFEVLDVETGRTSDTISGIYDSDASWSASGDGFYYRWSPTDSHVALPDLAGHAEVRFHHLGASAASDPIVRPATGDVNVEESVRASADGHWLMLNVERGFTRKDVLARDLRKHTDWISVMSGNSVWNDILEVDDTFFVMTSESAPRGRVLRIESAYLGTNEWTEVVPERLDATLVRVRIVRDHLLLVWRKDDVSELESCRLDGSGRHKIALPGAGLLARLSGDSKSESALATFESFVTPPEVVEIDPNLDAVMPRVRVPNPVDEAAYATEEVFFTSKDGARVPLFLVHRRDVPISVNAPVIYWGYGGFGISVVLAYSPETFPWMDRGGVYAFAAIRGGNDYGEEWHYDGMRLKKQNSIDDYIYGAEYLIGRGWTSKGKIMACGASNGGLLVGAAIVQRPDLFGAAFIDAPLTDMVRYPLFGQGAQWIDEYGSPRVAADLKNLLAYSPYHNVRKNVAYPAVFMYSPDSDDRVDPMHARKFVAELQERSTGGPVLLSIARGGGHAGPDGVEPVVERYADAYAFGLHAMGVDGIHDVAPVH